jgi:hypothetical protein
MNKEIDKKMTKFLGHLKKLRPLFGVSCLTRSSITRVLPQSGQMIKGRPVSAPTGYAMDLPTMELAPDPPFLVALPALDDSD